MADDSPPSTAGPWPACDDAQVPVLLVGTYHMDDPGLDAVNVETDDVLSARRQAELVDLTERLVSWEPTRVAVERPYDRADALNERYREYRSGERSYAAEQELEPLHPDREDQMSECRSEVVQVGFRLADSLGLNRVHPIDDPAQLGNEDAAELRERGFEPARKTDLSVTDPETFGREASQRLAESTLLEYHRWLNRETNLAVNHEGMFDRFLRFGEGENFAGPRMLATWFDRNLRMVHNLWRAVESGDDRILLLVGSGHVRVLRYLLDEAPMFCPEDPLDVLGSE